MRLASYIITCTQHENVLYVLRNRVKLDSAETIKTVGIYTKKFPTLG